MRLASDDIAPYEAVQWYLDRIAADDPRVNAYISLRAEEALEEAKKLKRTDNRGALWGLPLAISDVIDVRGLQTTAASNVLAHTPPASQDAAVVARLKKAGAIILGKLNCHEFAFGAMTSSERFGATRNPWSPERSCGGSGGAAAVVAAELAAGALATDTAGSIRISASYCGVTGVRPSTGRVSNRGVVPVSWTFDAVGPLAQSAEDCALLLEVVAGEDPMDGSVSTAPVPRYHSELSKGIRGLRIGKIMPLFEQRTDPSVAQIVSDAVDQLGVLGATVKAVDPPMLAHTGAIQQAILLPELAAAHKDWLLEKFSDYSRDFRARPLTGLVLSSGAYITGQRARQVAYEQFRELFETFDLLVAPTAPLAAPKLGETSVKIGGQDLTYRMSLVPFNSPWPVVGCPAVSVPCGFLAGMPVGMVLVSRRFAEATALRAAHAYQMTTNWHTQRPAPGKEANRGAR
jgi:aspartyl-tRNA(Asn)/glutamyl-tRNA(Gln) amidotransferase subunit A